MNKIIADCELLDAEDAILKGQAVVLMARSDKSYNNRARQTLESILVSGGLTDQVSLRIKLLQLKLAQSVSRKQLDNLAAKIVKSSLADDFELNLQLAFLGIAHGHTHLLEKLVINRPDMQNFIGGIILSYINDRFQQGRLTEEFLQKKDNFEITLAVRAVLDTGPEDYRELLKRLLDKPDKFRCSLLYYTIAQSLAQDRPAEAVEYYIATAVAKKSQGGDIDKTESARKAVLLAYKLYHEDVYLYQGLASGAFSCYLNTAGNETDDEMLYLYAGWLNDCGEQEASQGVLEQIAAGKGSYSSQAKFDLIIHRLSNTGKEDHKTRQKLKNELKELIDSTGVSERDKNIKTDAVTVYCQLLIEDNTAESARRVLAVLEKMQDFQNRTFSVMKALALMRLNKQIEAIDGLVKTITPDNCEMAGQVILILAQTLESMDRYEVTSLNFELYAVNCQKLADYCLACAPDDWIDQARLISAEIYIFAAQGDKNKLAEIEKILTGPNAGFADNDIDYLRCRARLSAAGGDFDKAAAFWGRICTAAKPASSAITPPGRWWQAKYGQLNCRSKLSDISAGQLSHAVDVLQNSYTDIPRFWTKQLAELKVSRQQ